ncbi:hypothetical protein [Lentilactobacillus hilgardii]|uniref:Uncharacterized protein n=1 Tax=Lentilactobacillus hilgardii (strain ATCC 8290 / DSM 20176 / CCUG 30140 / JCM 1155 / KCTC 3500 / NBRC 15886 / NCIMB 8040 / NRRL B-1843 / 9) TaxID=1423757 RepID=C0XGG8_LENH9|nr:hypothetical protein [Lentilactobacillus hilgardii]EEI19663.1 hypothetical protein HMPREF0497_1500 [Lentilactobacillus buchneri ATCC 11577]EEI25512.1 hypothetical protein HMPREF0519_0329 [Lentilactobacillus hilgardii DSM 20176 = ATCC 8290]MCP9333480.1 hypothetical protein [Lentilactobacillus hilgardii]MCP9350057.1 hypothetical protein [Lentilactobacillus hilgardii]MCP9352934.1 hypothetical protein [Lentilactobacillus hilgardii]
MIINLLLCLLIALFGAFIGVISESHWHFRQLDFQHFTRYLLVSGSICLITIAILLFEYFSAAY